MALSTIDTSSISGLGYGFKNRIINGAFGIWQRGTSFTPSSVVFGADRFASYKSGASAGDYAQSSDTPSGQGFTYSAYLNNADLRQSIELPGAGLPGDYVVGSTWTLSFWVKGASAGSSNAGIGWANGVSASSLNYWGSTQNFNFTTSWTKITQTFTVSGTPTGSQPAILVYISALGVGGYITGVQLEAGTVATSFDWRPYGTELSLCQRYYQKIVSDASYTALGSGEADTTTAAAFFLKYNTTMRASPSFTYGGSLSAYTANAFNAITAIGVGYFGKDSGLWQPTVGGATLVAGRGLLLIANGSTTAYFDLSAEL